MVREKSALRSNAAMKICVLLEQGFLSALHLNLKYVIMVKFILLNLFLLAATALVNAQSINLKPVAIIFDTDMGPDYDDVGAITLLHAFADSGRANILATIASTRYEGVAAVLSVLNTYFKRPNLPIGVPKANAVTKRDWQHWSDTLIANYPHEIKTNEETPDAVELYRKTLARQPDNSVTIVTVGFLTNISNLMKSGPDKHSSLTGQSLINKKVKKLVCMAGKFPSGKEFNIDEDAEAAKFVFQHLQRPVIFSGFEIGQKIKTGLPLTGSNTITNSPVKDVFSLCLPMAKEDNLGRMSWDETAVLVAVAGYKPFYKLKPGTIKIAADGSNTWDDKGKNHYYLVEVQSPIKVQNVINSLMMHQPKD